MVHALEVPLLQVEQVWMRYRESTDWVLRGCDLAVTAGERVLIHGANGSGKSTLLKVLAGLLRPQQGTCERCGHRPCTCAYLAQEHSIDWQLPVTVEDLVWSGRSRQLRWGLPARRRDRHLVEQALAATAMTEMRRRPISALSGGERQRALIARTLAQEASVLLLDEPLSGLDGAARQQLSRILEQVADAYGLTVVFTAHERSGFPLRIDRHLQLHQGLLAESASDFG